MSVIFPIELCRKYYIKRLKKLFEDQDQLRKFLRVVELWGKQGDELVRILIPYFIWPRFVWAYDEFSEGIGRGDGEVGDDVDGGDEGDELGAGQGDGMHVREEIEWWLTIEEFYNLLFEALKLPPLTPRAYGMSPATMSVLRSKKKIQGPHVLFKDSFLEALKRTIAEDPDFDPFDISRPIVINPPEDEKIRRVKPVLKESGRALIIYGKDISGSIDEGRKKMERQMSALIKAFVKKYYKQVEEVHLVHDISARIVTQADFFELGSGGGTDIASIISLTSTILTPRHPDRRKFFEGKTVEYSPYEYDPFFVYFSDGEAWSADDYKKCVLLLKDGVESDSHANNAPVEALLPKLYRLFYAQMQLSGESTAFHQVFKPLEKDYPETMRAALVETEDWIFQALQHFCKTGGEIKNDTYTI